jgi:hypothetical protein
LLYRQNETLATYPLLFDEQGENEWFVTGARLRDDTFFADTFAFTGGQCPACDPPAMDPQIKTAGRISMLFDATDRVQVKIDDGLFVEYRPFIFGYRLISGTDDVINLSGRWAIDNLDEPGNANGAISGFLPLVFDLTRMSGSGQQGEEVNYRVKDLDGDQVAQLSCGLLPELHCMIEEEGGGEEFPVSVDSYRRFSILGSEQFPTVDASAVRLDD